MKEYKKSKIASWLFDDKKEIFVGRNRFVVRGWIDNKRVYFLEKRDIFGALLESVTYSSIANLKAAL